MLILTPFFQLSAEFGCSLDLVTDSLRNFEFVLLCQVNYAVKFRQSYLRFDLVLDLADPLLKVLRSRVFQTQHVAPHLLVHVLVRQVELPMRTKSLVCQEIWKDKHEPCLAHIIMASVEHFASTPPNLLFRLLS